MKTRYIILLLFLFRVLDNYCQTDTLIGDCSLIDYDYELIVDMQHMQRINKYNYKYFVNKNWEFFGDKEVLKYEKNTLYYIQFDYVSAPENGFDIYDRIPIDTAMICLSDNQLDSIFYFAKRLFSLDTTLSLIRNDNFDHYDGQYSKVSLRLGNYSIFTEIAISFDKYDIFQKRYKELEDYMIEIINGL